MIATRFVRTDDESPFICPERPGNQLDVRCDQRNLASPGGNEPHDGERGNEEDHSPDSGAQIAFSAYIKACWITFLLLQHFT